MDTTTFICYTCALEYPSSSIRLLYCCPNPEKEAYYPFIYSLRPPPGASPISPQGMVQVCSICYKAIPQKQQVFGGENHEAPPSGQTVDFRQQGPSPRPTVAKSPANSAGSDIRFKPYDLNKSTVATNKQCRVAGKGATPGQRNSPNNGPVENGTVALGQNYRCYICERLYPRNHMEWYDRSFSSPNNCRCVSSESATDRSYRCCSKVVYEPGGNEFARYALPLFEGNGTHFRERLYG